VAKLSEKVFLFRLARAGKIVQTMVTGKDCYALFTFVVPGLRRNKKGLLFKATLQT